MKSYALACAVLCTILTVITCLLISSMPDTIRGDDKAVSIVSDMDGVIYTLVIDELNFLNSNKNVKIHVIPISPFQETRIEAIYSEELDNYGFVAKIEDDVITLSTDTVLSHPIKTFDVKIFAPIDTIHAGGKGYRLLLDAPLNKTFSTYLTGNIEATLSFSKDTNFILASAGSSTIDISGEAHIAHVALSGSSVIYGEYLVCNSADIHMSGSGTIQLSVMDNLRATLRGHSVLEYMGSPNIELGILDNTALLTQLSSALSSDFIY